MTHCSCDAKCKVSMEGMRPVQGRGGRRAGLRAASPDQRPVPLPLSRPAPLLQAQAPGRPHCVHMFFLHMFIPLVKLPQPLVLGLPLFSSIIVFFLR